MSWAVTTSLVEVELGCDNCFSESVRDQDTSQEQAEVVHKVPVNSTPSRDRSSNQLVLMNALQLQPSPVAENCVRVSPQKEAEM